MPSPAARPELAADAAAPFLGLLRRVVDLQQQQVELQKAQLDLAVGRGSLIASLRPRPESPAAGGQAPSRPPQRRADCESDRHEAARELPEEQPQGGSNCLFASSWKQAETSLAEDPQALIPGTVPSSPEDGCAAESLWLQKDPLGAARVAPSVLPQALARPPVPSPRVSVGTFSSRLPSAVLTDFVFKASQGWKAGDVQSDCILEVLPTPVKIFLLSLALLPRDSFAEGWRRHAYRAARCLIAVAFVFRWIDCVHTAILRFAVTRSGFPIEIVEFVGLALVFQMWLVIKKQLDSGGAALQMSYDVTRRGFEWDPAVRSLKRFLFASSCWSSFLVAVSLASVPLGFSTCTAADGLQASAAHVEFLLGDVCLSLVVVNVITYPICFHVLFGLCWSACLFCQFHKHELMWYAYALAEILQLDRGQSHLMEELSVAEASVTARLRHASATWVKSVIVTLAGICLMILGLMMYLLSDIDKNTADLLLAVPSSLLLIALLMVLGAPIATVSEVFEYDVLHALNTPLVVKKAQRHFGEQLLYHLHTLGWGFRFGQTVIDLRIVMNIVAALLITMVTTVCHAILTQAKVQT